MRYVALSLLLLLPSFSLGEATSPAHRDVTVSDWEAAFGFNHAEDLIQGLEAVVQSTRHDVSNNFRWEPRASKTPQDSAEPRQGQRQHRRP